MMIKKIALSFIGILILAGIAVAAYSYYYVQTQTAADALSRASAVSGQMEAAPNNAVVAGPVLVITPESITVTKQDGTTSSLVLASTTQVSIAGQDGQSGTPKKISDIKVGMSVLVTPSGADAALAQSVVLLPPPPAQ